MEDKVQAIGMTMAHAAENLLHEQDGVKCFAVMSASIYTVHIKPLEDALAKAEADKAVLVEAVNIMCRNALEMGYCNEIDCSKCDSRTALASVKGEPTP